MLPDLHADAGSRAAHYLRLRFPQHASKELQRAFNLTQRTAERVLAGQVSAPVMGQLIKAYGGDFLRFVYRQHLEARERFFWITEQQVFEAPEGHDIAARDRIGFPPSEMDHADYARRNLGWISVHVGPRAVSLTYGDAVEPEALSLVPGFLANHPGPVTINGEPVVDAEGTVERARMLAGAREAMLCGQWGIERRPIDAIKAASLVGVVRAWHQAEGDPASATRILAETGALSTSSLIHVDRDRFVPGWTGHRLGVDPAETIGRDIRDRADKPYAALVISHLREALEHGPTFYSLKGRINGEQHHYRRVALPFGRNLVVTSVERVAA